jgi:membrane-associated HD superfamily phosphohydrolase
MGKDEIMKTILGSIILLLALLFIPEKVLPSYNIIGYISILGLIIILGGLKTTRDLDIDKNLNYKQILKELGIYGTILTPLIILIYTNIRYKEKIENKTEYVSNYKTLKIITTILFGIQTYQLYKYIFNNGNVSTNMLLSILLTSILNIGSSVLLWSRVAFFITDGFSLIKSLDN